MFNVWKGSEEKREGERGVVLVDDEQEGAWFKGGREGGREERTYLVLEQVPDHLA